MASPSDNAASLRFANFLPRTNARIDHKLCFHLPVTMQCTQQFSPIYLFAVYDIESDSEIGTLTVTVEALEALLDLYND